MMYNTGIRNGVGLDEFRTSKKGAKYDYEVLEAGVTFWTAIEYTQDKSDDSERRDDGEFPAGLDLTAINRIMSAWTDGKIIVGGKSTRGLGHLKLSEGKIINFILPEDKEQWIDFDIYSEEFSNWKPWNKDKYHDHIEEKEIKISMTLKQESPLTVRVYSTEMSQNGDSVPDYSQIYYKRIDNKAIAVIPGTSWAGTFRHNMMHILGGKWTDREKEMEGLFGYIKENGSGTDESVRSKIFFSETYFDNGDFKNVSRNSIDRFSGGTVETALFTERMYYGGKGGQLEIKVPSDINPKYLKALAASVSDLHEGFLTVGGEASIGHGMLSIEKVEVSGLAESGANNAENGIKQEVTRKLTGELTGEEIYNLITEGIE